MSVLFRLTLRSPFFRFKLNGEATDRVQLFQNAATHWPLMDSFKLLLLKYVDVCLGVECRLRSCRLLSYARFEDGRSFISDDPVNSSAPFSQ